MDWGLNTDLELNFGEEWQNPKIKELNFEKVEYRQLKQIKKKKKTWS